MAAIFGETNFFFENWDGYSAKIPRGSKISSQSPTQEIYFILFQLNCDNNWEIRLSFVATR